MITVANVHNGDVLPHSLALLEGQIDCNSDREKSDDVITVTNDTLVHRETRTSRWPVSNQRFKALVHLERGRNDLILQCGAVSCRMSLYYEPTRTDRFVRLLYVLCEDDPERGRFQGPLGCDPMQFTAESAMKRIALGARLVQTFTAECLVKHGLPRRTFRLETSGLAAACRPFTLRSVSVVKARTMSERDLWCSVRDELARDPQMNREKDRCKFVAFLSFTRYRNPTRCEPESHRAKLELTEGHAALGGGRLALLSTGCLHTWAEHLADVYPRFTDSSRIDTRHLLDDSSYRGTYWACYSTTLGAMCHEMGHTFGLKHTDCGIMNRGFDEIHRVFIIRPEPFSEDQPGPNPRGDDYFPCALDSHETLLGLFAQAKSFTVTLDEKCPRARQRQSEGTLPSPSSEPNRAKKDRTLISDPWGKAFWDRATAIWLSYHKWFNEVDPRDSGHGPQLHGAEIRSRHGLRVVILEDTDRVLEHWEFLKPGAKLTFQLTSSSSTFVQNSDLDQSSSSKCLTVKAMDSFGNTMQEFISKQILFTYT